MSATLSQSAFDDARQLLADLQICTAAELARRGNYDSAESMLRSVVARPDASLAALDLCARVCAQRGALGEAARFWQRILDRDPSNTPAQAAMARLNVLSRRSVWRDIAPPFIVAAGLVLSVALAFKWQASERSAYTDEVRRQTADVLTNRIAPLERSISELGEALDAIRRDQGMLVQRQEQAAAMLAEMSPLPSRLNTLSDAHDRRDRQLARLGEQLASANNLQSDELHSLRSEIEQLRGELRAVRESSGAARLERGDD